MRKDVTIVPDDRLIIVDGKALFFDYEAPAHMHALQWHNGSGHIECKECAEPNHPLTEADYEKEVAPFVALWEAEKARNEAEHAAYLAEMNAFEKVRERAVQGVDGHTSKAITGGFDYEVDGQSLHFSYDTHDQQNFADAAAEALTTQSLPEVDQKKISWTGYTGWENSNSKGKAVQIELLPADFLKMYTSGAIDHKNRMLADGKTKKAELEKTKETDEVIRLMDGWGIDFYKFYE